MAVLAAHGQSAPLLERQSELRVLTELVALGHGSSRVMLIEGPAGIGKSSLVREAARMAGKRGYRVLGACASESERSFAHGVIRQLFERPLREAGPDEREVMLSGAAELARYALAPGSQGRQAPDAERAFAVMHGLYWLCVNLATSRPITIIVDDAHAADTPSLRWIEYCAARLDDLPVALIIAARDQPDDPLAAVRARVVASKGTSARPAALSAQALGQILNQGFSGQADSAFVNACHQVTGGNPYLVSELTRELSRTRVTPTADSIGLIAHASSEAMRHTLRRRVAEHGPRAVALAEAVAALAPGAELEQAAELAHLDGALVAEQADVLAAIGILQPGVPLRFCHPIVEAAIRDAIPDNRRALLHAAAARTLARDDAPPERVSAHLLLAPPRRDIWVVTQLCETAGAAIVAGAPEQAIQYLRRALHEPPADDERQGVLAQLGRAEMVAIDPAGAEHLAQALARAPDSDERARLCIDLARAHVMNGRMADAVTALDEQLEQHLPRDHELGLRLEAERAIAEALDVVGGHDHSPLERFAGLAGSTEGERLVLLALAWARCRAVSTSADKVAELIERALGDGQLIAAAGANMPAVQAGLAALLQTDRLKLASTLLDECLADVRRRGALYGFVVISAVRAGLHLRRGELNAAEAEAQAAVDAVPNAASAPMALGYLLEVLAERGEIERGEELLGRSGFAASLPDHFLFHILLFGRARLRLAAGEALAARDDALELGRRMERWGVAGNPAGTPWRTVAIRALVRLDAAAEARCLAEEQLALARRWDTPRAVGTALWHLALTGPNGPDQTQLEQAVGTLERSPARLELACALTELGAAVRRANQRSSAREPLRRALELAHRCGATALEQRARQELVVTGARPRKPVRTGVDALTPTERRVASMAAEGMTNREIAQAMFVTPKTINTHLGHIYTKLAIHSRHQLANTLSE